MDAQSASFLSLPLVRPELTTSQITDGLILARRHSLAYALARPCDVELAVRILEGSPVRVASGCGFPHGSQNTATKLYEARDLLRRGAREIHLAICTGKLLSREFQHVQTELAQFCELCRKEGAVAGMILESAWLDDETKIIVSRAAERAGVNLVKTFSLDDLKLMRKHLPEDIAATAAGDIATLAQFLELRAAGAAQVETESAAAVWEEGAGLGPGNGAGCRGPGAG